MACDDHINSCVKLLLLLVVLCAARASAERTKTLDFDVKPGGVVQTFSAKLVSITHINNSNVINMTQHVLLDRNVNE